MNKVFEDAIMDVQAGLISLCLEVIGDRDIDKVYAYCSIEKKSLMFNACFEVNGEIKMLHQLGIDKRLAMQFLRIGTGDLNKIKDVCKTFEMPTPTEIKMSYEKKTGKFGVKYRYDEICYTTTNIGAQEVFINWVHELGGTENTPQ